MNLNKEYQNISIEQLDEAFDLQKLRSFKQKIKPFHFIEFLNKKNEISYEKIKVDFFKEIKGFSINTRYNHHASKRNDSFLDKKQKSLFESTTLNTSQISIKQGKTSIKQSRQKNRKVLLVEIKQNEYYSLNGSGVIKLKDGRTIFGAWRTGLTIGIVKIIYPSGNTYMGDVLNYNQHGYGQLCYSNGDKYKGSFSHGKIEGFGTMYYKQGSKIIQGIWHNGVHISE